MITDRKSYDIRLKERHRPVSMDERVGKIRRYPRFPPVIVSRSALGIFFFSLFFSSFSFSFSSHALVCMRSRACERRFVSFSIRSLLLLRRIPAWFPEAAGGIDPTVIRSRIFRDTGHISRVYLRGLSRLTPIFASASRSRSQTEA